MSWRAFGAVCGVTIAFVCAEARADPLDLAWSAPPECPQAATAEARVRQLAGAERATGTGGMLASVTIQQAGEGRWSATLKLGASTRVLEGESCAGVADAAVVILAMAVDPESAREAEPAPEATEPEAPVGVAAAERPVPANAAPAPRPAEPERAPALAVAPARAPDTEPAPWGASLRSFGEWGMLPAPSWGGVVSGHAAWSDHRVELSVLGLLPRDAVLSGGTQGGEFSWFGFQLSGCQLLARPAFVCGGVETGRLSGTGFGAREVSTGHAFWAAPGVELLLTPRLGDALAFEISAGMFVALLRPQFALDGVGVVHQPGPVSGRLELGIGWY